MIKIGNIILPEFPLLLAPMEDVSDPPFRRLCKAHGADIMYSEFISSEGLIRDAIKSRMKLDIFDYERPVGIQIFGGDEEAMAMSSKIVSTVNPDIIDINFGCPVKKVVCKGAGAGVLKDDVIPHEVPVVDLDHAQGIQAGWRLRNVKCLVLGCATTQCVELGICVDWTTELLQRLDYPKLQSSRPGDVADIAVSALPEGAVQIRGGGEERVLDDVVAGRVDQRPLVEVIHSPNPADTRRIPP